MNKEEMIKKQEKIISRMGIVQAKQSKVIKTLEKMLNKKRGV
jgi:hypothetical protein